ncbi:unnamed protein product, partial [Effrenium voratum]
PPAGAGNGDNTDAKSDSSSEELNVHKFLAELEAELDRLPTQEAELDYTDGAFLALPVEAEQEQVEEVAPAAAETSDEEVAPKRRLRGKQAAPAAYQRQMRKEVLKRAGLLKRPATTRGKRSKELCRARRGTPCQFNLDHPGQPARVHPDRGQEKTDFDVAQVLQAARWNQITAALWKFAAKSGAVLDAALGRVREFLGDSEAEAYTKKIQARQKQQKKQPTSPTWEDCWGERKLVGRALKDRQRAEHEALVRRDQRVARRKFFFPDKVNNPGRISEEAEAAEKAAVLQ